MLNFILKKKQKLHDRCKILEKRATSSVWFDSDRDFIFMFKM